MAKVLSTGALRQVYVAHGIFCWSGPTWLGSAWFYQKGGGSLFDLGVYNLTMLTGLLGPAHSVVVMAGTAIRELVIDGEIIPVEADDNTALILDHGNAVYSVIQTGFVYAGQRDDWTIPRRQGTASRSLRPFPGRCSRRGSRPWLLVLLDDDMNCHGCVLCSVHATGRNCIAVIRCDQTGHTTSGGTDRDKAMVLTCASS